MFCSALLLMAEGEGVVEEVIMGTRMVVEEEWESEEEEVGM